MRTIFLNGNEFEWDYIGTLKEEARKYGITIDSDSYIGSNVRIDSGVIISQDVIIDSGVRIDLGVKGKVYKVQHLSGLYKYKQDIIYTDKDIYIRMGCLTFTVDKWKGNFWNNDNEFLNDGDEGSVDRLEAFNICMRILKLDEIKG